MRKDDNQPEVDNTPENEKVSSSIPPAMLNENRPSGTHNRSHAAHLDSGSAEPHSKPAGDLRRGSYPTGRKQP